MEITLYKKNGNIEWYQLSDNLYKGFNKKTEAWEYTLERDTCGPWILRGQGKDKTGKYRHDLMELVS